MHDTHNKLPYRFNSHMSSVYNNTTTRGLSSLYSVNLFSDDEDEIILHERIQLQSNLQANEIQCIWDDEDDVFFVTDTERKDATHVHVLVALTILKRGGLHIGKVHGG